MRVLLKFVLDCDPDAAWRALQSPTAFREVAMPWLDFRPETPGALPTVWDQDEHRMRVKALGAISVGTQAIRLDAIGAREPGVRILRDSGGGTSGLLAAVPRLDHRMAIAPDPAGPDEEGRIRTLYRDKLEIHAGALTPLAWYTLWAFWQWRGLQLRRLAPTWAYDPPPAADHPEATARDHPESTARDHPESTARDHPESTARDHPESTEDTR
ncbi:MAG TPA: hypothetical protein VGN33_13630 [Leifsonia sp.]|nr:hypothetical protein [Leifsonia sp.]